mmetsp:Transcript_31204/g.92659  ORF Transcript_31204/g.92659 Transcript_31204/m.92659 type:complete len:235 (+) Transcript_31204:1250-1954(+)
MPSKVLPVHPHHGRAADPVRALLLPGPAVLLGLPQHLRVEVLQSVLQVLQTQKGAPNEEGCEGCPCPGRGGPKQARDLRVRPARHAPEPGRGDEDGGARIAAACGEARRSRGCRGPAEEQPPHEGPEDLSEQGSVQAARDRGGAGGGGHVRVGGGGRLGRGHREGGGGVPGIQQGQQEEKEAEEEEGPGGREPHGPGGRESQGVDPQALEERDVEGLGQGFPVDFPDEREDAHE